MEISGTPNESYIPPWNSDCWTIFSREFNKILNRFESTVTAQFYGHTHNDEYKIFYDDTGRPYSVALIAGSLTTYNYRNPGYRIYTVDARQDSYVGYTLINYSYC